MKLLRKMSTVAMLAGLVLSLDSLAENHDHHHHHQKKNVKETPLKLSEESIYNLNSELLDENGNKIKLESFRGKPVVISMAYTSCAYTCPLIVSQMQQLEKKITEVSKKDIHFVLVSFDPEKDTPATIKAYAKKKNLSGNWSLLTSKSDKSPREIASVLGIKYSKVEGGDYDHSFIITVLDKEGVPLGRQVGANSDLKDLIKLIP